MRKNFLRKATTLLMAALVSTTTLVACSEEVLDSGAQINEDAAQLRVFNFNGGLGSAWLSELEEKFEEAHKNDTHWEAGKTGVEIIIDNQKFTGDSLGASIASHKDDVFLTEGCSYYDYVAGDYLKDITDIVTTPIASENKTIESKMDQETIDFFKTNENKYYAIPFYSAYEGINYDIDLFDDMGFYFEGDTTKTGMPAKYSMNGTKKEYYFTDLEGTLSAGPDGKSGTYDDGLPATYEQFYALCKYMKDENNVTPMLWNNHAFYMSYFLASLQADYEGKDSMMLNFTYDGGETEIIDEIKADGTITTKKVHINNSNGYEVYSQAGRYYALEFVNTIIQNGWVSDKAFGSNENGMVAQTDFLNGKYSEKKETIAMLVEGSWWENEADATFKVLEGTEGKKASRSVRRTGFMPFPKATEEKIGEPLTVMSINNTEIFVKKNISDEKYELAKAFIQFILSDEGLNTFTKHTSCYMLYNYNLTEEVQKNITPFGKSLYDTKLNSVSVFPASKNPLWLSSSAFFTMHTNAYWNSSFTLNGSSKTANSPITMFREKSLSVADYFKGCRKYAQDNWNRNFSDYFEV